MSEKQVVVNEGLPGTFLICAGGGAARVVEVVAEVGRVAVRAGRHVVRARCEDTGSASARGQLHNRPVARDRRRARDCRRLGPRRWKPRASAVRAKRVYRGPSKFPRTGDDAVLWCNATWAEFAKLRVWRACVSELAGTRSLSQKLEGIRKVASAGSAFLRCCEGRVEKIVAAGGPSFFSPHVDVPGVRTFFGHVKKFPRIDQLLQALCPGAPVDVSERGCLTDELKYGNHPSVLPDTTQIMERWCPMFFWDMPWFLT